MNCGETRKQCFLVTHAPILMQYDFNLKLKDDDLCYKFSFQEISLAALRLSTSSVSLKASMIKDDYSLWLSKC